MTLLCCRSAAVVDGTVEVDDVGGEDLVAPRVRELEGDPVGGDGGHLTPLAPGGSEEVEDDGVPGVVGPLLLLLHCCLLRGGVPSMPLS